MVIHFGWAPEDAATPFSSSMSPFALRPFADAGYVQSRYRLELVDCLKGIANAVQRGWFDVRNFDAGEYCDLISPLGGDISVPCPKFVAMKGPLSPESCHRNDNEIAFTPEALVPELHRLGVSCVVRLNDPDTYDKAAFEDAGIAHYDLFFDDCTAPPDAVVERFLDICDREGRVAVHCRAGLGRTGTLIAAWLMRHAGFGADEAIGWLRIVRPGSVIGPQQAYLKALEGRGWRGNALLPAGPDCGGRPGSPCTPTAPAAEMLAAQVTSGMLARAAVKAGVTAGAATLRTAGAFEHLLIAAAT